MGKIDKEKVGQKICELRRDLNTIKQNHELSGMGDGSLVNGEVVEGDNRSAFLMSFSPRVLYFWEMAERHNIMTYCQHILVKDSACDGDKATSVNDLKKQRKKDRDSNSKKGEKEEDDNFDNFISSIETRLDRGAITMDRYNAIMLMDNIRSIDSSMETIQEKLELLQEKEEAGEKVLQATKDRLNRRLENLQQDMNNTSAEYEELKMRIRDWENTLNERDNKRAKKSDRNENENDDTNAIDESDRNENDDDTNAIDDDGADTGNDVEGNEVIEIEDNSIVAEGLDEDDDTQNKSDSQTHEDFDDNEY